MVDVPSCWVIWNCSFRVLWLWRRQVKSLIKVVNLFLCVLDILLVLGLMGSKALLQNDVWTRNLRLLWSDILLEDNLLLERRLLPNYHRMGQGFLLFRRSHRSCLTFNRSCLTFACWLLEFLKIRFTKIFKRHCCSNNFSSLCLLRGPLHRSSEQLVLVVPNGVIHGFDRLECLIWCLVLRDLHASPGSWIQSGQLLDNNSH